ncbi:PhoX family protein [Cereibacter johrii]|uniref:PhoX family protein n=1 Tax=Cereibacter johrii TaxID=445629 RepID=UPI000DCC40B3|nr:alkaline phosphatase PhoX [Cereibacter johrii]RAZ82897.1 alkaline phosphatase [Cereibacter johrii]
MTLRSQLLAASALIAAPILAQAGEIAFAPVPFAADDAAKRAVLASERVTIDGKEHAIGFTTLARSGDRIGDAVFAALTDRHGQVVRSEDGSEHVSVDADFTSLLRVGGKLFSVTHFESRPGAMYVSELQQDASGKLTPVSTKPVDFSEFGGVWVPCAGSVTPWETHLGSEEYPADAREIEEATALEQIDDYDFPMVRYEGVDPATMTLEQFREAYNPYRYGFPNEVTVAEDGTAKAAKHFAMGRVAVELAKVMPDRKTAYISDDGTNVGLFMFVADREGDLSAGTLYAAKWVQTSDEGAGAATLDWIDLGHADTATIRTAIEKGVKFSDIFETAAMAEDGTCPEGFLSSNAEDRAECLKVRPGMEAVASRLETRRYASMLGATTEFRKMEGIAHDPDHGKLYLAMSEVSKGMEAGAKQDRGGRDDIRLAKNACGAVYELPLGDDFRATAMKAVVAGKPTDYAADSPYAGNMCDVDGIANPDNITYIPGYDTLIVGEDTGEGHQNDAVWAMKLGDGALTRIFSTPYGSESTSVYWYPDIGGHGYLTAVVQHPYGESDEDKLADAADARAYVGYIGPFPAMGK